MVRIKLENLPATFQAAVTICWNMAVRYCWIDSLCILKNDDGLTADEIVATKPDLARWNSVMAKEYRNSHFTISADLSIHLDSGVFSKSLIEDHQMPFTDDAGNSATVYSRQTIDHDDSYSSIPDLETRGWVF